MFLSKVRSKYTLIPHHSPVYEVLIDKTFIRLSKSHLTYWGFNVALSPATMKNVSQLSIVINILRVHLPLRFIIEEVYEMGTYKVVLHVIG